MKNIEFAQDSRDLGLPQFEKKMKNKNWEVTSTATYICGNAY